MELEIESSEQPALELIRQGLKCDLSLVGWRPGFECELVLRVRSSPESAHMGLMFLWSSLAFLEASPLSLEGIHPRDYRSDDGWGSLDFLKAIRWEGDRLVLELGVVRGRQIETSLCLLRQGVFIIKTRGRGDSALHWYETFSN